MLDASFTEGKQIGLRSGRYNNIVIPSIFKSGKRGVTALEIDGDRIRPSSTGSRRRRVAASSEPATTNPNNSVAAAFTELC